MTTDALSISPPPLVRDGTAIEIGPAGLDLALRAFKKRLMKSGVLSEVRRRQTFVSRSEQRRRKSRRARRREREGADEARFRPAQVAGIPQHADGTL